MKLSLFLGCLIALVAVAFVQADSLQDEIDKATKKFCSGKLKNNVKVKYLILIS